MFAGFAATPATTSAQAFGYAFGGPVGVSNMGIRDSTTAWHVGGGGEILIRGGLSFGGELGSFYFPSVETTSGCCHQSRTAAVQAGLFSLNHSYHFGGPNRATRGMRPFVTGGFSFLLDADVAMPLWNVGGGMDWWLGRHAGVRLEVRDQLWAAPALLGFRFGVVFR
jgi:hypothetical protein